MPTIEAYIGQFKHLAQSFPLPGCPWQVQPSFGEGATLDELDRLEQAAGFSLPTDLREFLAKTDIIIRMDVHNGYAIGDVESIINLLDKEGSSPKIAGELSIPIAFDGGGNSFLLSENGQIWKLDHETQQSAFIADTFLSFLEKVVEDWSAFVENRVDWKYLV